MTSCCECSPSFPNKYPKNVPFTGKVNISESTSVTSKYHRLILKIKQNKFRDIIFKLIDLEPLNKFTYGLLGFNALPVDHTPRPGHRWDSPGGDSPAGTP